MNQVRVPSEKWYLEKHQIYNPIALRMAKLYGVLAILSAIGLNYPTPCCEGKTCPVD